MTSDRGMRRLAERRRSRTHSQTPKGEGVSGGKEESCPGHAAGVAKGGSPRGLQPRRDVLGAVYKRVLIATYS